MLKHFVPLYLFLLYIVTKKRNKKSYDSTVNGEHQCELLSDFVVVVFFLCLKNIKLIEQMQRWPSVCMVSKVKPKPPSLVALMKGVK